MPILGTIDRANETFVFELQRGVDRVIFQGSEPTDTLMLGTVFDSDSLFHDIPECSAGGEAEPVLRFTTHRGSSP